jgi:hypothetical protein
MMTFKALGNENDSLLKPHKSIWSHSYTKILPKIRLFWKYNFPVNLEYHFTNNFIAISSPLFSVWEIQRKPDKGINLLASFPNVCSRQKNLSLKIQFWPSKSNLSLLSKVQ